MAYAYKRGKRSQVMHLTQYDRFGNLLDRTWCGREFDTTINVPLGRRLCKQCIREVERERRGDER